MAIKNSYQTKLTAAQGVDDVLVAIKKASILDPVGIATHGGQVITLVHENHDIPFFTHPIYDADTDKVYVDGRGYCTTDRTGGYRIQSDLDYKLNDTRAQLELVWARANARGGMLDVWKAFEYANEIFVRWLSDLVVARFGLNPSQATRVYAVTAFYNIGLYWDELSDFDVVRHCQRIARDFVLDASMVAEVYERIGSIPTTIEEYIEALITADISTRVKELNPRLIYNILGGSWFMVANNNAILAVGIEFPPAFAAIVYSATQATIFKRTRIGALVDKLSRQHAHENYVRAMRQLINNYVGE